MKYHSSVGLIRSDQIRLECKTRSTGISAEGNRIVNKGKKKKEKEKKNLAQFFALK
jgi:hypothetical protein